MPSHAVGEGDSGRDARTWGIASVSREDENAKLRKRYAEDAEYRERRLALGRAHHRKRRERAQSDPEFRERERDLDRMRTWRYTKKVLGMTPEKYDRMLARQQGVCRICGKPPSTTKVLCVDHRHATGWVRGLLCFKCNFGLGYFDDSPRRLVRAAIYIVASTVQEWASRIRAAVLRLFAR
jgi:hypothetical protein